MREPNLRQASCYLAILHVFSLHCTTPAGRFLNGRTTLPRAVLPGLGGVLCAAVFRALARLARAVAGRGRTGDGGHPVLDQRGIGPPVAREGQEGTVCGAAGTAMGIANVPRWLPVTVFEQASRMCAALSPRLDAQSPFIAIRDQARTSIADRARWKAGSRWRGGPSPRSPGGPLAGPLARWRGAQCAARGCAQIRWPAR